MATKIDFTATQEYNGMLEFLYSNGTKAAIFPMKDLEQFVSDKGLNIAYEVEGNNRMVTDPDNDNQEVEVEQYIATYIDENWEQVTEKFYHYKQPSA